MKIFEQFISKYNGKDEVNPQTENQIQKLEIEFDIFIPNDWKLFLLTFGGVWTPEILDIIVDDELDIYDVQNFWNTHEIENDKKNEWTAQITMDLIPFASDSMGNIFAFKTKDIKEPKESAEVYFFDHDFNTVKKISNSFTEWINEYNQI